MEGDHFEAFCSVSQGITRGRYQPTVEIKACVDFCNHPRVLRIVFPNISKLCKTVRYEISHTVPDPSMQGERVGLYVPAPMGCILNFKAALCKYIAKVQ